MAQKDINWRPVIFNEEWAPITDDVIPGIAPYYYISSFGRIYSTNYQDYIRLFLDKDGYVVCSLHKRTDDPSVINRAGSTVTGRVNRLVLATFRPVDNWRELECNHRDSVRSNNYLWNLEWVTPQENTQHGLDYGRIAFKSAPRVLDPEEKLTIDDVNLINEYIKEGELTYKEIAKKFNIAGGTVRDIAYGKLWKGVSDPNLAEYRRVSKTLARHEVFAILDFFEAEKDRLNDKSIYPSLSSIVRACMSSTGLDKTRDFEAMRKIITGYLRKEIGIRYNIYNGYTYHYDY